MLDTERPWWSSGSVVSEKNSPLQEVKPVALLVVQLVNDKFAPTFLALSPESTYARALPGSPSVRLM